MRGSICFRRMALLLAVSLATLSGRQAIGASPTPSLATVNPSAAGMDAATLARIPKRLQELVAQGQISGAVTLVARNGQLAYLEAVGLADVQAGRPMAKDTIFAIASMTKPITATALMILQDEGRLSIDDPLARYVPEFAQAKLKSGAPQRPLTIRDAITHTAGLGGSQQNQGSLEKTVRLLAEQPLRFEPGSKWQYSPGLTVCGRIIEVASGQPYHQFLGQRIFRPLKMVDTTFFPSKAQQARLAKLYKPGSKPGTIEATSHWLSELSEHRTANPSGGLFSTASDLARFYQMILNGGELDGQRIVSQAAVRQMTSVQTGDLATGFTPGNGWGLGWCIVRQPQGVTAMLSPGTFGHGGAFGTQGWVDPKRQMIFVLMIQRTKFGNGDASIVRQAFQQLAVEGIAR